MSAEQVELLKQFVQLCKQNPAVLHKPELEFYREYLESLNATIPPANPTNTSETKPAEKQETNEKYFEEQQEEDELSQLKPPELDNSGVIADETGDEQYPMGDLDKVISEEELEMASEHRDAAADAYNEGDYKTALENYTKAIELNPGSAILHAKRANTLLKMSKMNAAIKDCDKAISINPDSATSYKFRGRANRLLGKWLEAHHDLALSCKLDYDDTAYEWLKEVEPNAKKLQEYQWAKERLTEEKKEKERAERVRRAQEANKRAAEEAENEEGDESGGGFGMGPFTELFKELSDDPELLAAMKNDPTLIQKLMEIMQNPANMMKHMGDPNVQKLLSKLGAKFGASPFGAAGAGMGPGTFEEPTFGAQSGGTEQAGAQPTSGIPKKAPEPDLD